MPENIFQNLRTMDDYTRATQEFEAKKAAAKQALQSGNLESLSKKNAYATQILSGATATGNQANYDAARQHLVENGIDITPWAPDIATGTKQAQAARLALSPLGSLLNAGLKQESNDIARAGLTGVLPTQGMNIGGVPIGNIMGGMQQPNSPQPTNNGWNNPDSVQPPINNTVTGQSLPPQKNGSMYPAEAAAAQLDNVPQNAPQEVKFTPPSPIPNETRQAYNDRVNQAFAQYKESPEAVRQHGTASAAAGEVGKAIGDAQKTSSIMRSNLPAVLQRFENMRKASEQAGFGTGNNETGTGYLQEFHKNFRESPTAEANATLQQYAAQGILPELGPQLAQAGVRGNKFLETIASSASGLDLSANPASKQKIVNGLENTYINNLKSTEEQLRQQGLPALSSEEIDAMVADIKKGGFAKKGIEASTTMGGNQYVKINGEWHVK